MERCHDPITGYERSAHGTDCRHGGRGLERPAAPDAASDRVATPRASRSERIGRHLTRLLRERGAQPPLGERALLVATAACGALVVFAALTVPRVDRSIEPLQEIVALTSEPTVPLNSRGVKILRVPKEPEPVRRVPADRAVLNRASARGSP